MVGSPLQVYLDSSDYSSLSDPKRETPQVVAMRDRLLEYGKSNTVEFRFSTVHLSEMAPLDAESADAAERRADLLVELCGRKCLVSFDRLLSTEVQAACGAAPSPINPFSDCGEWYPELNDVLSPISWAERIKEQNNALAEQGLNRAQRRYAKRKAFKARKPRKKFFDELNGDSGEAMAEVLSLYPMRKDDAAVLYSFVLGNATKERAEQAFLESLKDPRWMMRWFRHHMSRMSPISAWLRRPSENVHRKLCEVAELARKQATLAKALHLNNEDAFPKDFTHAIQQQMLFDTVKRLGAEQGLDAGALSKKHLRQNAPGLYTVAIAAGLVLKASTGLYPREPLPSDFVDVIHAGYVPYVDIFRADGFIANQVKSLANNYGTTVVGKLTDLPHEIERKLAARENMLQSE